MPLRKVCRRPETDYRLQQLHAMNDATPVDQQKTSMDLTPVHAIRVTSAAETVPKQQPSANVAIVPPISQANVSLAPQTMNIDPRKAETTADMKGGNTVVRPGGTVFTSDIITSSVPVVSSQNMAEGK